MDNNINVTEQAGDFSANFIDIFNGLIQNISSDNENTLITVTYEECLRCERSEQRIVLVAGNHTLILNERGNSIPVSELTPGMMINASVSSAMTRSIPPQASVYAIRIIRRPASENITIGRIIDIDRQNRTLTTISGGNLSSAVRFNVPVNVRIFDVFGRPVNFSRLMPGLRVKIRHTAFMTASIPPQTTAFEIRIIR